MDDIRGIISRLKHGALVIGGWTLIGTVFSVVSYVTAVGSNRRISLPDALQYNLVVFYLWGVFSIIIVRFSRRFPIELKPLRLRNLALHVPLVVFLAALHQALHLAGRWYLVDSSRGQGSLEESFRVYFGIGVFFNLLVASLIALGAHAVFYYQRLRAAEVEQSSLKAKLAEAQLRALKMQLHPHFLFNTLHSISSLILENPQKANDMVELLGDFLRLTLEHSDEQLVTLAEEAEFLRCYLEIEQVRFGDRLKVKVNMAPSALVTLVPHLILQPIVENAIQHGIAPRAGPGCIAIGANRVNEFVEIEVSDSGAGSASNGEVKSGHGVGLSNVRARLKQIYGTSFLLEVTKSDEGGTSVFIKLPVDDEEAKAGRQ